jgi:hypothetical protein
LTQNLIFAKKILQTFSQCGTLHPHGVAVAEKHNFCGIQQKIPQISDFAKNQDSNPPSHGDTAADIGKMFAKFFLRKSDFGLKNTIFMKIRSDCKLFSQFSQFFRYSMIFGK